MAGSRCLRRPPRRGPPFLLGDDPCVARTAANRLGAHAPGSFRPGCARLQRARRDLGQAAAPPTHRQPRRSIAEHPPRRALGRPLVTPRVEESQASAREPSGGMVRGRSADVRALASRRAVVAGAVLGFPVSLGLLMLSLRHLDGAKLQASLGGANVGDLILSVAVIAIVYLIQADR